MFENSVVEYKDRGPYGNNRYRGNTTGFIVKDFLEFVHSDKSALFVDPAEGGGTSRDVATEMGIRYRGLDLRDGFNLIKDDLHGTLGEQPQTVFFHPPYAGMIKYSGNMWGSKPDPDDLSQCNSVDDFLEKLQAAMANIYDALKTGGHYAVLMGNWRKSGTYYPLCSLVELFAPGKLREEIVKIQNNCVSNHTSYSNRNFVPIMHEKLMIFQKDRVLYSLDYALSLTEQLGRYYCGTWKNIVRGAFRKADSRELTLQEIYALVDGSPRCKTNQHWQAKVRQTLQRDDNFVHIDRGVYSLAA